MPSYRRSSDRVAFTLIEVVAALALLAALLTSMVLAFSAHHRQSKLATQRQAAVVIADELLAKWFASSDPRIPRNGAGTLHASAPWSWRTQIVNQTNIDSLPVQIVRLEVFPQPVGDWAPVGALAQVDVLLPVPQDQITQPLSGRSEPRENKLDRRRADRPTRDDGI